jgi:uncharacterized membrane protein
MKSDRPVIRDLERSRVDTVIEVLALVAVVVLVAVPVLNYSSLPGEIPQHFNLRGEADGWGDKSTLILMPVMGAILYVGLTVLSRFPHVYNYPWAITEGNARRQYSISRQMIAVLKLVIVAGFAYITWSTIRVAVGRQNGLNSFFAVFQAPLILGVIAFYLFKGSRAR